MKVISQLVFMILVFAIGSGNVMAQSKADSLFSHKGFKFNLGVGGTRIPSEDRFDNGGGIELNLGYGFSSKSTLWLGLVGSAMEDANLNDTEHTFGGLSLMFQYKFISDDNFQPYAKVGLGAYGIGFEDTPKRLLAGGGIQGAIGFDYFFTKRFGIGLELNLKDITMISETIEVPGGSDIERDLEPHLNRDVRTLMITFTIQ